MTINLKKKPSTEFVSSTIMFQNPIFEIKKTQKKKKSKIKTPYAFQIAKA
jgi:hypothetical protein